MKPNNLDERLESGRQITRLSGILAPVVVILFILGEAVQGSFLIIAANAPTIVALLAVFYLSREIENHTPRRLFIYACIGLFCAAFTALRHVPLLMMAGAIGRGILYLLPCLPTVLFLVGCVRILQGTPPRERDNEVPK